ncbi:unnamed protein product [Nesidiocoris tenuis]|uniref:Uncharacterized protein n=1 Tax=Nesidiocoris tenuis TaxID=355587 RepID=A0A6H5H520_9HEMI|nr:unnamed protein product [Nesidiocoris tenuis]
MLPMSRFWSQGGRSIKPAYATSAGKRARARTARTPQNVSCDLKQGLLRTLQVVGSVGSSEKPWSPSLVCKITPVHTWTKIAQVCTRCRYRSPRPSLADDEGVWTKSVTGNSFDTGNRVASIIFMYRLSRITNWLTLFSIPCQTSSERILEIHVFQLSQFQNLRVRPNESHLTVPRLRGSTKCRCNISIVEVCQPQTQVWPVIRGRNSLNRRAPSVIWLAFSNESNQRRQASDRIWHSSWTSFGQVKAGDRPLQNLYRKITESDDQAENRRQKWKNPQH